MTDKQTQIRAAQELGFFVQGHQICHAHTELINENGRPETVVRVRSTRPVSVQETILFSEWVRSRTAVDEFEAASEDQRLHRNALAVLVREVRDVAAQVNQNNTAHARVEFANCTDRAVRAVQLRDSEIKEATS